MLNFQDEDNLSESSDEVENVLPRAPDIRKYIERPDTENPGTSHSTASRAVLVCNEESNPPCTSTTQPTTNKCTPDASKVSLISEMFPYLENEKICQALIDSNMNVQEAINQILGGTGM
jgi:hypothetical protein